MKTAAPPTRAPEKPAINDGRLGAIDLLAFNGGENPYQSDSVLRGFPGGAEFYRGEVARLGCAGRGRVLDLMCGFGRWSLFLAEANDAVVGLDRNEGTVNIARGLAAEFGFDDATFFAGDVGETRTLESGSFDAVWIWNALIYVERDACLREVARLTRPGGRLVIGSMNSTGRLLQKLAFGVTGRSARHRSHRRQVIEAVRNGPMFGGRPNFATRRTMPKILDAYGYDVEMTECCRGHRLLGLIPKSLNIVARKRDG